MLPAKLLFRSALTAVYVVVVPALRKVREGRGTRSCGGFCSLKRYPPSIKQVRDGLATMDHTKVKILRFKNLPLFRHDLAFKTTFEVFTRVGPDNSLERLTERSVGLVTDQPSDVYELFVTLL